MTHHTMNAMGHDVPNMIGVDKSEVDEKIPRRARLHDDGRGTAWPTCRDGDAAARNTLPMMAGRGPFGLIEMGGMFTIFKVREGISPDDYRIPAGTKSAGNAVAWEWTGELPDPTKARDAETQTLHSQDSHGKQG